MPNDQDIELLIGSQGLNLRDHPLVVGPNGLVDSQNWGLDERGALVKRLGFQTYPGSAQLAAVPLEMSLYTAFGASPQMIFACTDGHVYRSPGDGSFTSIAAGLSTSAVPSFAQLNDKLYWSNGVDPVQQWDGSTLLAIVATNDRQTLTSTATGGTFTLVFNGATSSALNWNDSAATIQTALQGMISIGGGNATCTGGPLNTTPVVVTFTGTLAAASQNLLTIGTNSLTGGSLAIAHTTLGMGAAPLGKYLTIWRNRLWIAGVAATPHRIFWSAIGDPTQWNTLNWVDLFDPRGDSISGLATAPNIARTADGSDGVLVYEQHALHRIIDDTDNAIGAIVGGGNVLVDGGTGAISNRTIRHLQGRIWSVGADGIYSTDGHTPLNLESGKLSAFFTNGIAPTPGNLTAIAFQNRYRLACTKTGDTANSLVLDVHTFLPRDRTGDGDYPIMAHTLPVAAWIVYPTATGDAIFFCDSSAGDTRWVRQLGVGGWDTDGSATQVAIAANATTGASDFGITSPKRMHRIIAHGRGDFTVAVIPDLSVAVSETGVFNLASVSGTLWNAATWGNFLWGTAATGTLSDSQWYSERGRLFSLYVAEASVNAGTFEAALGVPAYAIGGAAVERLLATVTPLTSY